MIYKDEEYRYAIWMAHKRRCAYTGQIIENYSNLEIDHIIPRALPQQQYAYHGLSDDYDIKNSLDNLLPTLKRPNSLKGKIPLELSIEKFFRDMSRRKISDIEKERLRFVKLLKQAEKIAISNHQDQNRPETDPRRKFKVTEKFTNREESFGSNHYWNSTTNVALNANVPSKFKENGNCSIAFKDIDTMISLTHDQIVQLIEDREVRGIRNSIKRGDSYEGTKVFVVIFSNAVHLLSEVFNDLVIVLDSFLTVYSENQQRFIDFIQANDLQESEDEEGYEILDITRDVWQDLIEYSKRHDIDAGVSSEHCFNSNDNYLIALNDSRSRVKFMVKPTSVNSEYWHGLLPLPIT